MRGLSWHVPRLILPGLFSALAIAIGGCGIAQPPRPSTPTATSETKPNEAASVTVPRPPVTQPLVGQLRITQPAVRLSAGVAVPENGTTGTLMSFSIGYRFTRGGPAPTAIHVWVIEQTHGDPHQQPVQMKRRGTLHAIFPGVAS